MRNGYTGQQQSAATDDAYRYIRLPPTLLGRVFGCPVRWIPYHNGDMAFDVWDAPKGQVQLNQRDAVTEQEDLGMGMG
jgi:hypothetical protein